MIWGLNAERICILKPLCMVNYSYLKKMCSLHLNHHFVNRIKIDQIAMENIVSTVSLSSRTQCWWSCGAGERNKAWVPVVVLVSGRSQLCRFRDLHCSGLLWKELLIHTRVKSLLIPRDCIIKFASQSWMYGSGLLFALEGFQ